MTVTNTASPRGRTLLRLTDPAGPEPRQADAVSRLLSMAAAALPKGRRLSDEAWGARHRGLNALLWAQVPVLLVFALYRHYSPLHALYFAAPIAAAGVLASLHRLSRRARSSSTAAGLVGTCSLVVALSGGVIEAHFSFFVVVAFLTLYQEWMPFLIAIVFVLLEHGIVGVVDPSAVYQHAGMPGMSQDPWKWAFIHAGFVLAAGFGNLLAWRLTEQEALHDSLTGLPNRVLFAQSISLAYRGRGRATTGVLFIDLDNFKDANDGFGHDSGDRLLRAITARLRAAAREGDVVARLGGDEFGVVLHDLVDASDGTAAAQRYLDAFSEPFQLDGLSMLFSASIGLVHAGLESADPHTLMRYADLAMYAAKRAGGAQVRVYQAEMHDVVVNRATRQVEMRQALANDEFDVHYQPLVDIGTGETVGTEALVRWQHPKHGLIPPVDFIGLAEQSGLIVALGEQVLRKACAQTAAWHARYPDQRPIGVSVNLSPRQLSDHHIIDTVASALAESGLESRYLCLEITEGAVINDLDTSLPRLRALKAIGVRLALDDFGTGYSSLSYLRQMPVDSVKVDRSFITDLGDDQRNRSIVHAIIELAHALGMSVTAEGIETEGQLAQLRELSSNLAQGYLLGRPMHPEQLTERLDAAANPVADGAPV